MLTASITFNLDKLSLAFSICPLLFLGFILGMRGGHLLNVDYGGQNFYEVSTFFVGVRMAEENVPCLSYFGLSTWL